MVKLLSGKNVMMADGVKVLVLGATGMLGHQLCRVLSTRMEIWGSIHGELDRVYQNQFIPSDHLYEHVEAMDIEKIEQILLEVSPQAVVNAIGIVKQRDEAKQAITSIQINSLFPHLLAEVCNRLSIRLVHISTDCVFSGSRGGYSESDLPDPLDLYGRTKLLGELTQPGCLTLRTSIIGWELSGRSSLLEWFAAQRGRHIKGYQKAIYSGFPSSVLATLIGDLIETRPDLYGLYHVASAPISKYQLLVNLKNALGWDDIHVTPDDHFYCDRSLIGTRFEKLTGWRPPAWDEMIQQLASEWSQYEKWRQQ